ncbi:MAG: PKD domain-containing protein [Planctomycetes bacterium]|nr:PKD domain-containing protein [Planctomycetota bacterium]
MIRTGVFPAAYQGNLLFGDYANRWIRRAVVDGAGQIVATAPFERDPAAGTVVDLAISPDGALYSATIGVAWSGNPDAGAVHRYVYSNAANLPPVAYASASPTQGVPPLLVSFTSAGSLDPDGEPKAPSYLWNLGDRAQSALANPAHLYGSPGLYSATLTVSDGAASAVSAPIPITVGTPPVPTIAAPSNALAYIAGEAIHFSGGATDAEDGVLPASALSWNIVLVRGGHSHPFLGPISGVTSGSFVVPATGHPPEDTYFKVWLTAVDSSGLGSAATAVLSPTTTTLVFDTVPSGISLFLDGASIATPRVYQSLVGYQHTVEALAVGNIGTSVYSFLQWLGGAASQHVVTAPAGGANHTAVYATASSQSLTLSVPASNRNADYWQGAGLGLSNFFDAFGLCAGRDSGGHLSDGLPVHGSHSARICDYASGARTRGNGGPATGSRRRDPKLRRSITATVRCGGRPGAHLLLAAHGPVGPLGVPGIRSRPDLQLAERRGIVAGGHRPPRLVCGRHGRIRDRRRRICA